MGTIVVAALITMDGCATSSPGKQTRQEVQAMATESEKLPFGLDKSQVGLATVQCVSRQSAQVQRTIRIQGNGAVQIEASALDGRPAAGGLNDQQVSPTVALRLLDMIEGENFFGLDDFILPPEKVEVRRIIEVALPGRDKKIVTYDAPNSSEFERIAGAVALVAAIASRGGTQPSREVADASLQYAYLSSKPGAGDQEIHLGGDGNVKLLFRKTANDPAAEVREMSGGQNTFAALWDLFEQERFLTLPDYQSTGRARVLRSIKFSRGSQTRELYAEGIDDPAFERLAGAIKLAAGILLPEALNQRFFPNL